MPLAHYSRAATQEFWAEHWGGQDAAQLLAIARRSPLTMLIEQAIPSHGLVLEAGCGLAQYVVLLRERGFRAVGTDWSGEGLRRCREAFPGTPLAAMDLAALGVQAGSIAAYLSLGVVEHDPEGPGRLLREAHRVLVPGGRLILSVPYLNGVRRLVAPMLAHRQQAVARAGGQFYQYLFTRREVQEFVEGARFRVVSMTPYDPGRMIRSAVRRLRRVGIPATRGAVATDSGGRSTSLARALLYTPPLLRLLGHMILAVAVKE